MAYDKPGWAKRIEALERVRDNMKANVLDYQYLHNTRHYAGGEDPLTPANIGAANQVHKHSYTDITDLQAMINGYAPGVNPAFPNGIGGIKDLDLTALANVLKSNYALGGGRLLVRNSGAQSSHGTWCHVIDGCTPGKKLYVTTWSDSGAGRAGCTAAYTHHSWQLSGLASLVPAYIPEAGGPDLATALTYCRHANGQRVDGLHSNLDFRNAYNLLNDVMCAYCSGMSTGSDSDSNTIYSFSCIQQGTIIISPTVCILVSTKNENNWGTAYDIWES